MNPANRPSTSSAHRPQPFACSRACARAASASLAARVRVLGKYSITSGSAFSSANGSRSASVHARISRRSVRRSIVTTAPYAAAVITDVLDEWTPHDPAQAALLAEYRAFVAASGPAAVDRSLAPAHLTASCFVLTPDLSRVLLCFHRKGQFWVQLGGHLEPGDVSLADAASREAREEGGIADLRPAGRLPADVHRHELSAAFGRCRTHWDVGFVAYARRRRRCPSSATRASRWRGSTSTTCPPARPTTSPVRLRTVLDEVAGAPGSGARVGRCVGVVRYGVVRAERSPTSTSRRSWRRTGSRRRGGRPPRSRPVRTGHDA